MPTLMPMRDRSNRPTHTHLRERDTRTILGAQHRRRRRTGMLSKGAELLRPSTRTLLRAEDHPRRHLRTIKPPTILELLQVENHMPRHTRTLRREGPQTPTYRPTGGQQLRHTHTLRREVDPKADMSTVLRVVGQRPQRSHTIAREKAPPERLTRSVLRVESRGRRHHHTRILRREGDPRRVPVPTLMRREEGPRRVPMEGRKFEAQPLCMLPKCTPLRAHTGILCPSTRFTTTGQIITIIISPQY
jgi:hypothetical protein